MKPKKMKLTWNAPFVLCFAVLSFGTVLLNLLTGGVSNRLLFTTYRAPLSDPLTWIRLFTHVLGHSGWTHYIGNMSYLLLLGPLLEERYGSWRILGMAAVTAVITGAVNALLFPDVALCGASGIVFAFILLTSFTSFREGEIPVTVLLVAVIFIGQQVYEGIFLRDNVSNLTHILGGVVGAAVGYRLNKKTR